MNQLLYFNMSMRMTFRSLEVNWCWEEFGIWNRKMKEMKGCGDVLIYILPNIPNKDRLLLRSQSTRSTHEAQSTDQHRAQSTEHWRNVQWWEGDRSLLLKSQGNRGDCHPCRMSQHYMIRTAYSRQLKCIYGAHTERFEQLENTIRNVIEQKRLARQPIFLIWNSVIQHYRYCILHTVYCSDK